MCPILGSLFFGDQRLRPIATDCAIRPACSALARVTSHQEGMAHRRWAAAIDHAYVDHPAQAALMMQKPCRQEVFDELASFLLSRWRHGMSVQFSY